MNGFYEILFNFARRKEQWHDSISIPSHQQRKTKIRPCMLIIGTLASAFAPHANEPNQFGDRRRQQQCYELS